MAAELRPGELLDQFFERADAARQGDEAVGALEHLSFALVHVAGDDQLLGKPPRPFAVGQKFGDDAGHVAAVFEHGLGERAHQAGRAAAIDQPDIVFGEDFAEARAVSTKAGSVPGLDPQ